jgi:hypothetical protein
MEGGADRRRHNRLPIRLPVRVRGREASGATWEEVTSCLDVCPGGVGMAMSHPVEPVPDRLLPSDDATTDH